MGVDDNQFQITDLADSQTFLEWFNKTNDEIIEKLNFIKVFDGVSGDGISASTGTTLSGVGSGKLSIELSGSVDKGVTFQDISVLGNLNYNFSGSEQKSLTEFSGSSAGFTFGQAVRVDHTGNTIGVTWARSANSSQAESIGLIGSIGGSKLSVITNGKIQGNFTTVAGKTLSPGCVYFLDPIVYGGLTINEPNIAGQVSKPVLVGITSDTGIVLNYRGQELGFSGGTGSGIGSLKVLVDVTDGSAFTVGTFVSKSSQTIDFGGDGREQDSGIYLSDANDGFNTGLEEPSRRDLVGMITAIRGNQLEIISRGYVDTSLIKTSSGNNLVGSPFFLSTGVDGKVIADGTQSSVQIGHLIDDDVAFIDPLVSEQVLSFAGGGGQSRNFFGGDSGGAGISYGINSANPVINGSFDIWQRHIGTSTEFEGNSLTDSTYFADRWVFLNGITSDSVVGGTFGIQRGAFTKGQRDVLGEPKYYGRVTNNYARTPSTGYTGGDFVHVENRLDSSEYFLGRKAVVSVHTRAGAAGSTLAVLYKQYFDNGVGASGASITTKLGDIELSTGWNGHAFTFTVPNGAGKTITGDDEYAAIAFDVTGATGTFVDFAQLQFQLGTNAIVPEKSDESEVLDQCRQFYQRSYDEEISPRSSTMSEDTVPNLTTVDIPVNHSKDYYYNFPVKMRKAPEFVTLYSPSTGVTSDGFNRLAGVDMRLTSGTIGPNNQTRSSGVNQPTIQVGNTGETGIRFEIISGGVVGDQVSVHYIADADNKKNL